MNFFTCLAGDDKMSPYERGHGSDILLVGINYDEKTKKHKCYIEKRVK